MDFSRLHAGRHLNRRACAHALFGFSACEERSARHGGGPGYHSHPILTSGERRSTSGARNSPPHFCSECSFLIGGKGAQRSTSSSREGQLGKDYSVQGVKVPEDSPVCSRLQQAAVKGHMALGMSG